MSGQYNAQYGTQYGQPTTNTVILDQPALIVVGIQFRETPVRTECQHCHAEVITVTQYEEGTLTWLACFLIGIFG